MRKHFQLKKHGIFVDQVFRNLPPSMLYEHAIRFEKNMSIASSGALVAYSGEKTGRSPTDKRVVKNPQSEKDVWWGPINVALDPEAFDINRERACDYLNIFERLYCFDGFAGWDPRYRFKVRVICSRPYHALFMHTMLIRPNEEELNSFGNPDVLILNAGHFPANQRTHGMTSKTSVDLNLEKQELVILGTGYAGEMKKGVFTVTNYLAPKKGHLSMHCSATAEKNSERSSLLFGLSGTGKTTLSADPNRDLIGDDEHVWSDDGIYNIEGGCYAKTIKVAGTEMGVKEPQAVFSPCFGGPFLVWHPFKYAELLAEKMKRHQSKVWLVNTGWNGGDYETGKRIPLQYSRAIIDAIHQGQFDQAPTFRDPLFGFEVMTRCPNVPSEKLKPRESWANPQDYDQAAKKLAALFQKNFKEYEGGVSPEVKAAGPAL